MNFRPGRRRSRWPAAVLAVTCVLMAAGAAGLSWIGHGKQRAAGAVATPSAGRQAETPAVGSVPPSPGLAVTPEMRLAGLRWVAFYGIQLPVSPAAGPRHLRAGLAWGFTDTPLGALLAAVNIGVRANAQWGPGIFGPTIRRQVTGAGAAALLASCQHSYQQERQAAGLPAGQPLGRGHVTEEAFRWVTYTPAAATVDVVSAGPGAQGTTDRAVTQIEVAWSGQDWQVIAPLGGDWGNSAAPLTSLRGYTAFPIPSA